MSIAKCFNINNNFLECSTLEHTFYINVQEVSEITENLSDISYVENNQNVNCTENLFYFYTTIGLAVILGVVVLYFSIKMIRTKYIKKKDTHSKIVTMN